MKRWICAAALGVALVSGPALADGPQTAPGTSASADEQTAQSLSDQAYEAYEKGNYARAVEAYLGSYKLVPTADILYNVATIYDKKLNEPKLAVEYYRRYNAAPDAKPDLVGKATARIATLTAIRSDALSATGASAGQGVPNADASSGASGDSGRTLRIVAFTTGAVGLVGLGTGVVTAIVANGKHSDSQCSNGACPTQSSVATEKSAASMANISTVSFIAGGVLLGAGIIFYLVAPKSAEHVAAAVHLLPHAGAFGSAFDLGGAF